MLILIDESGDPGLKIASGSSKYFVVALVVFEDMNEASAVDARIELLRNELGLAGVEFHFNKLKPMHRTAFLAAVAPYNFSYFAVVIDKVKLPVAGFQVKETFYNYACGLVLESVKPRILSATIIIDGVGSKEFRHQLKNYLRRLLQDQSGNSLIKKLKLEDSAANNLVQLADMVAGAIARSNSEKKDATHYRSLIAHRESLVQFWPK